MIDPEKLNNGIMENFKDTNCDMNLIDRFLSFQREGKSEAQLKLLQTHRIQLLEKLHDAQENLDRLDYFIFEMRKNIKLRGYEKA